MKMHTFLKNLKSNHLLCISFISLLFLVFLVGVFWNPFHHHQIQYLRIGCINSAHIQNTAEPFVRVQKWIEDQHSKTQNDLSEQEKELRRIYEWLKIAPKNNRLHERKREFDQKVTELERMVQKRKNDLAQQFSEISSYLEEKLRQTISAIAHEKSIAIVLNRHIHEKQSILYANQDVIDVTEDVIEALNRETKGLRLPDAKT